MIVSEAKTKVDVSNPFEDKEIIIYDIETYRELFIALFFDGLKYHLFTISDLKALKDYISDENKVLVGYNNISFDDLVLKAIFNDSVTTDEAIYNLANTVIQRADKDLIYDLKWKTAGSWYKSIDLMQLAFTDDASDRGKASLKDIAVRMNSPLIQELPYKPEEPLDNEKKQNIIRYCKNDVNITCKLWNQLSDEVKLRLELERLYNVKVTSFSRPQAAEEILKQLYIRKSGIPHYQLKNFKTDVKEIILRDCIPSWIKYETPYLQDFFNKVKDTILPVKITKEMDKIKKYVDGSSIKQTITIGNNVYSFGIGGFHSEDKPGIFISDERYSIIDLDATSYYPAIIILLGLHPAHLTSIWTDNYKEVTEERIKAKRAGETLKAEAMKIIINSSFGKTGNQYSFMYDPKLMVTVTLTGQLAMIMLIERLELCGINIISANTDGITCRVPVDKKSDFELIRKQWENLTQFQLEENIYNRYVRRDVNNYIAEFPDGKIKRKGIFNQGSLYKKNDAKILSKALEQYFINNIPLEETINNHSNIYDFLYSFKATKGFTVHNNGSQLQRINRWYVSESGIRLEKERTSDKQRIGISQADSAMIVNFLRDTTLPIDLNKNHYLIEAKKIVYRIENKHKAKEIEKLGLYPIPKEFKRNPAGSKMKDIRKDWSWGDYTGVACYTGITAGIIGIDIDIPEICKIYNLLENTLITWHGDGITGDVLTGKKKGTVIYRCSNENILPSKGQYLKQYGFEVIYGNNSLQLTGFHSSGEEYHYSGEVRDLPRELEKFILKTQPKKRKNNQWQEDTLFTESQADDNDKTLLKNIIKDLLPEWEYRELTGEKYKLQGYCPYQDEHTRPSNRTDFDIIFQGNGIYAGCFHSNCESSRIILNKKLNEFWKQTKSDHQETILLEKRKEILRTVTVTDPIEKKTQEFDTIYKAFYAEGNIKLISAPTGAGKTYNSATYFLEELKEGNFVIYVTSNKTSMQEFIDHIEARTGKTIAELYVQELRKGYDIEDVGADEETTDINDIASDIKKSTLGIITHHTYFTRKGLSSLHYGVLGIVDKYNSIIILDEVDSYIQAQNFILPLQSRYERKKHKGWDEATYNRKNKCPGAKNKPKCSNCHLECLAEYKANKEGIPELKHMTGIKETEFINTVLDLPALQREKTVYIPERGLSICQIEQHKDYLENKEYKYCLQEEEKYNFKNTVADLVNCSHNPVIYNYSPTLSQEPIAPEDISELPDEERYRVKYPCAVCQVDYLSMKDKSSLHFLSKHAKEVILLSATVSQSDKEFLQDCFNGEVQEINITQSSQKIDELLVIGYGSYINYINPKTRTVNMDDLQNYGKILIFEPTRAEVKDLYKLFPEKYPVAMYDVHDILVREKFADSWQYLLTHSRGNIGRAVNLPQFYTCFINTTIYKPSNAYDLKKFTLEEIIERQDDDRKTTTIQNAGRILRGSGRKVICLSNVTPEELDYFKNRFGIMVNSEIKTLFVESDQVKLFNAIDYYHKTGEVLQIDEYSKIDRVKDNDISAISPKQRANLTEEEKKEYQDYKEEKKLNRRDLLIQKKIEQIKELQKSGMSWRDITRKINFHKFSSEEQNYIKNIINPDG